MNSNSKNLLFILTFLATTMIYLYGADKKSTIGAMGPLDYQLYPRGGFNGWDAQQPFEHKGDGAYEIILTMAPGYHEVKMADDKWQGSWCIPSLDNQAIELGKTHQASKGNSGFRLLVRQTSRFKLHLNIKGEDGLLRVEHLGMLSDGKSDPHAQSKVESTMSFRTWDHQVETATFSVQEPNQEYWTYAHSTTQTLRDPVPQHRSYSELENYPRSRTGNLAFDGLFALALEELRQNSVEEIRDGNYNDGQAIAQSVFETGAKWHYVWTRDLSYAADLGLANLDVQRVVNSLLFKTGTMREGISMPEGLNLSHDGLQMVQDTGSGGSWPISTDRMSWAFGAQKALGLLGAEKRQAFAQHAYIALKNTLEIDRVAAFDQGDGLYTGEQSFLDWRDQSYSKWILDDIASLGSSKSLSTNAGHYQALLLASQLAKELGHETSMACYLGWAHELKNAINEILWLEDEGLYSSLTAGHMDGTPMKKFDWLGQSLAIITGIASDDRAKKIMASYPHSPMGPPVIFPQQPDISIYHNRAIWPFVTAYGLRAATKVKSCDVANRAILSLVRGAALNLSNMENFEWLSQQPLLLDLEHPELIGPEINSQRQLWSVGGYLGMVINDLFGIKTSSVGVSVEPFITTDIRRRLFGTSDNKLSLINLKLRGKVMDVALELPEAQGASGFYKVESVELNGNLMGKGPISWETFVMKNRIKVVLGNIVEDLSKAKMVEGNPYDNKDENLFAPNEPSMVSLEQHKDHLLLTLTENELGTLAFQTYRNGIAIGKRFHSNSSRIELNGVETTGAYSVVAIHPKSGLRSHHSQPLHWGWSQNINVDSPQLSVGKKVDFQHSYDGPVVKNWGAPQEQMSVQELEVPRDGRYAIQVKYHNDGHHINLGITNGVKKAMLKSNDGKTMATAIVQMPHTLKQGHRKPWRYSTPMIVNLKAGTYQFSLRDFMNMSYLSTNKSYTSTGGTTGPRNHVDIGGIRILCLEAQ